MEPKEFSPLADLIDGLTDGFLSSKMEASAQGSTTSATDAPQAAPDGERKSSEPVTTSSHGK